MHEQWLLAFGIIFASIMLAWGSLLLLSPKNWAELSSVDWMPVTFDITQRGQRMQLRIAGAIITTISLLFLYLLFSGLFSTAVRAPNA
jgi:hypothetical protein